MRSARKVPATRTIVASLAVLTVAGWLLADAPAPPKASSYAPAEDLVAQVGYYISRLDEALAKKEDYAGANESRTKKDAHTLTALAQVLSLHDEDHALKASAPALFAASRTLAKSSANYDDAVKALAAVKQAAAGSAATAEPVKWEKAASMGQLMKQVELMNTVLKRGINDPRRFKRSAKESAEQAAAMSAIAQVVLFDTHEVKDPKRLDEWYSLCGQWRDAASEVRAAAAAGDQAKATAGLEKMSHSCEKCHEAFRN